LDIPCSLFDIRLVAHEDFFRILPGGRGQGEGKRRDNRFCRLLLNIWAVSYYHVDNVLADRADEEIHVKVMLVASAVGAVDANLPQHLTTYLVNESVAFDAGSLGLYADLPAQLRVRHVFLSHTHIDHIASLPIFLDSIISADQSVSLHASEETLAALRRHFFNGVLWPDVFGMTIQGQPFITTHVLQPGVRVTIGTLEITPIAVNHTVPTLGFLVAEPGSSVLLVMDTGPTQAIWDVANRRTDLKAVFLEASFPNELTWLAETTKHLTPAMFGAELQKLRSRATTYAVHIKATFQQKVAQELADLHLPQIELVEGGRLYEF